MYIMYNWKLQKKDSKLKWGDAQNNDHCDDDTVIIVVGCYIVRCMESVMWTVNCPYVI